MTGNTIHKSQVRKKFRSVFTERDSFQNLTKHELAMETRVEYSPGLGNIVWTFMFSIPKQGERPVLNGFCVTDEKFLFWFLNREDASSIMFGHPITGDLTEKEWLQFNRNFKLAGTVKDFAEGLKGKRKQNAIRDMAKIEELKNEFKKEEECPI